MVQRLWNTFKIFKNNLAKPITNWDLHGFITCIKTPNGQRPMKPSIDLAETSHDPFTSIARADPQLRGYLRAHLDKLFCTDRKPSQGRNNCHTPCDMLISSADKDLFD